MFYLGFCLLGHYGIWDHLRITGIKTLCTFNGFRCLNRCLKNGANSNVIKSYLEPLYGHCFVGDKCDSIFVILLLLPGLEKYKAFWWFYEYVVGR